MTQPFTAPGQLLSFESYVLRGRTEREHHGEFSYVVEDGRARVTKWRCDVDPTPDELLRLDEQAQDHCAEWLADMAVEVSA